MTSQTNEFDENNVVANNYKRNLTVQTCVPLETTVEQPACAVCKALTLYSTICQPFFVIMLHRPGRIYTQYGGLESCKSTVSHFFYNKTGQTITVWKLGQYFLIIKCNISIIDYSKCIIVLLKKG